MERVEQCRHLLLVDTVEVGSPTFEDLFRCRVDLLFKERGLLLQLVGLLLPHGLQLFRLLLLQGLQLFALLLSQGLQLLSLLLSKCLQLLRLLLPQCLLLLSLLLSLILQLPLVVGLQFFLLLVYVFFQFRDLLCQHRCTCLRSRILAVREEISDDNTSQQTNDDAKNIHFSRVMIIVAKIVKTFEKDK